MDVDDFLHRLAIRKLDIVEEAAAQEGVGQFLLVVGGDDHDRPFRRLDRLLGLVDMEFHAVEFLQQIVGKFDVRLVDFVDQQHWQFGSSERLPQFSLADIVGNVVDAFVAELAVTKAGDRVIFIQALMRLGGRLDIPLDQRRAHRLGDFIGQNRLAGTGLALDKKRAPERHGSVDSNLQIIGCNIVFGTVKTHDFLFLAVNVNAKAIGKSDIPGKLII